MGKTIAKFHFQVEKVTEDVNGIEVTLGTQHEIPSISEAIFSAHDPDKSAPSAIIRLGREKKGEIIKHGDKLEVVVSVLE